MFDHFWYLEGSLRVDASVSVHQPHCPLGVRAEIKNLNSLSALNKAISYEISRQIDILEDGGTVVNETRAFDIETGRTVSMRDKEKLHDYRFMQEPNLPPLRLYTTETIPSGISSEQIINVDLLREQLPELPNAKRVRIQQAYGLLPVHSNILVNEQGLVDCYDMIVSTGRNAATTAIVCIHCMFGALNNHNLSFLDSKFTAEQIGAVVDLVVGNIIDFKRATQIFEMLLTNTSKTPQQLVDENNLSLITDKAVLEECCLRILTNNKKAVMKYKRGKTEVINFFIGQVQKELDRRADGRTVKSILIHHLSSDRYND